MLDNLKKYWMVYTVAIAIITAIGWIFTQGGISNEKENRLFSTPTKRIQTETYMDERPSAVQEMRQLILDSIAAEEVIKNSKDARRSRAVRDSTYLEEVKARRVTDSINRLNADQMFQIKEELKRIKKQ